MNQNCDNFKDKIAELISGSLEKGHDEQLQNHIKSCSKCAAFEIALKSEDEMLSRLFAGLQTDIERQQNDVIRAISCVETSRRDKFITRINRFVDHPVFKLTAAAAVIVVVTFYSLQTLTWLHDLKHFMDVCSVTMK
jgi:anti-sigma factor RsiW